MTDPLDTSQLEPRREHPAPKLGYQIADTHPQGFWGSFADALILDSSIGQFGVFIGSRLAQDQLDREQRNKSDERRFDMDYNALNDMREELYGLPMSILEEIYDASSPGEVRRILHVHEENMARRNALEHQTGIRILAGLADPINLVPIPLAVGKGVWTGMKAAAPTTAGVVASTEAMRHALDPTSNVQETAINIGSGFLFSELLAGAAGAYQRGGMRRAGHRLANSGFGRAASAKTPKWMKDTVQEAGSKMQNAFDIKERVNEWINTPIGDLIPARAIRARQLEEAQFNSTIKDTLDMEGIDYDTWLSGQAPDIHPPHVERYQGVEDTRHIIVDRSSPEYRQYLGDRADFTDQPGTHQLFHSVSPGKWEPGATGSKRDLAGTLDPLTTRHLRSFNTPEAWIFGQFKARDLYPDAPDKLTEPEAYEAWAQQKLKDVARDADNIHQTDATMVEAHSKAAADLNAEFRSRQRVLDDIEENMKVLKKELRDIKLKLRKTRDKGWQTRRKAAVEAKQKEIEELEGSRWIAESRLKSSEQVMKDADKSPSPEDWDIRPTYTGIEQAFGATEQMPWYRIVKTKLRESAPEKSADWQRIAYELAGSPGLASYGHAAGESAGASVESMARTWIGDYTRVKTEVDRIYYEEYAKIGEQPTPTAIWALEKKQWWEPRIEAFKEKFKVGEAKDQPNLMSITQFRQEVGKAMMRSDTHTEPTVAKAAREYRQFVRKVETEGRKYEVFRTQQSIERRWAKNQARIEHYEELLEQNPTWNPAIRDKFQGWINDMELENIELDAWLDAAKNDTNTAWKGESGEHAWFHRVWNLEAVNNNEAMLKEIVRRWYLDNPTVMRNGVRKKLSVDPVNVEARVEETYAAIRREAILGDSIHAMSHGRKSYVEHLEDYRDVLKTHLDELKPEAAAEAVAEAQARAEQLVDINTIADYQGIKVTEPATQRIHPEHGGKSPVSLRRDKDGNPVEIHINKAEVAKTFRNQQWANPRTKGIEALPADEFKTLDEWVTFLLEHEYQHTKHPIVRSGEKGYAANENAINKAALKALGRDRQQPARGTKRFDRAVTEKRIEIINTKLEKVRQGGVEAPLTGFPSGLIGRRLDIPNELLIEIGKRVDGNGQVAEEGVNFIHTNVEHVLFHYTQRIAPVIEMAKRYGDFRMSTRKQQLYEDMLSHIKGKPNEDEILEEMDVMFRSIDALRDKVLGVYGIPDDPSALSTRTIRMLMAWNTLTAMGRAFLTAINDIGMVVQVNGIRNMMGDLFDQFTTRNNEMSKWKLAAQEVEWAGQALEIQNAIRSRAIMDLPTDQMGFSKLEQWTYDQQGNFFFLNLLSGWTDYAKRFSGSIIQSKMIKNAIEWRDGTLTGVDLEEMGKAGVTREMAIRWANEWERAGANRAPGDNGMYLASTMEWLDDEAVQAFRATLGQAVDNIIITPLAADKPNFMSKDWGRMIMQYHGFSMAATHRIFMSNMQKRDKRALATVSSMVFLSLLIDQFKRPDYIQLSLEDQLYRAVEISGTLGMITDMNTMLEGATAGEYGFRSLAGLKNMERYSDWGSRIGAVAGAVPNQWLGLAATVTDSDASADKMARTLRYMLPYNNMWIWNDWVTRTQRSFADLAEE